MRKNNRPPSAGMLIDRLLTMYSLVGVSGVPELLYGPTISFLQEDKPTTMKIMAPKTDFLSKATKRAKVIAKQLRRN